MKIFDDEIIGTRDENGVTSIMRNGVPLLCAYKTPIVIVMPPPPREKFAITPEQQQPPQIIQPPCTSLCPLFCIETNVINKKFIRLACANTYAAFDIVEEKTITTV